FQSGLRPQPAQRRSSGPCGPVAMVGPPARSSAPSCLCPRSLQMQRALPCPAVVQATKFTAKRPVLSRAGRRLRALTAHDHVCRDGRLALRGAPTIAAHEARAMVGAGHVSPTERYLELIGVRPSPRATCPFDPGYDPVTVEAHLEQSAHLMGTLKIS